MGIRRNTKLRRTSLVMLVFMILCGFASLSWADSITDRIDDGKTIRLGFANEAPWAYPGENQKPLGFANAITIGILKVMGYTNIEPVVTDWGGLMPGLTGGRTGATPTPFSSVAPISGHWRCSGTWNRPWENRWSAPTRPRCGTC